MGWRGSVGVEGNPGLGQAKSLGSAEGLVRVHRVHRAPAAGIEGFLSPISLCLCRHAAKVGQMAWRGRGRLALGIPRT